MRLALSQLKRYIATPCVSKHRIFVWLYSDTLPDHALIVFARDDDYMFGILHSLIHEIWARNKGTQLREAESGFRYTPTTTFETFPFPWSLGDEPKENENNYVQEIADSSRRLNLFRHNWLNLDDSIKSTISPSVLKRRTLTIMYNALEYYRTNFKSKIRDSKKWEEYSKKVIKIEEVEELDQIHDELNNAVFRCYGWQPSISNEELLEKLLALNLSRANIVV